MGLRACGAVVFVALGALFALSGTERERALLGGPSAPIGALEASVAARPGDTDATLTLAQAYLEAHLPGLALALVEAAPAGVRANLPVQHVYARALIDEGRNDDALAVERAVVSACGTLLPSFSAPAGCDPHLLASAIRRSDVLRELLSLGVQDVRAQPEAAYFAYRNATREARLAME